MPFRWTHSRDSRRAGVARAAALGVALSIGPGSPAGHPRAGAAESEAVGQAREHYKTGDKAFKAGRYEEAFREWEQGYKLSGRPLFLLNMGHAERKRGDLRSARALYKRYLLMEPETNLRGEVEAVLKDIDSALAAEQSAARSEPRAANSGTPMAPAPAGGRLHAVPPDALSPPSSSLAAASAGPASRWGSSGLPNAGAAASDTGAASTLVTPASVDLGAAPPEPAFYRRWWFWTAAGAVVAVGLGVVLLRGGDSYTKAGSLGSLGTPR